MASRQTDIFVSYSRQDLARVTVLVNALQTCGFTVLWDQELPAGESWDKWIRDRIANCRAVVVAWTETSTASNNVQHEAALAGREDKLISVFMDQLSPTELPLGMFAIQGVNLSAWSGDVKDVHFLKLRAWLEMRLTPSWLQGALDQRDAALGNEAAKRAAAEVASHTFQGQLVDEVVQRQRLQAENAKLRSDLAAIQSDRDKAPAVNGSSRRRDLAAVLLGAALASAAFVTLPLVLSIGFGQPTSPARVSVEDLGPLQCRRTAIQRVEEIGNGLYVASERQSDEGSAQVFGRSPSLADLVQCGWPGGEGAPVLKILPELCVVADQNKFVECNWNAAIRSTSPGLSIEDLRRKRALAWAALQSLSTILTAK